MFVLYRKLLIYYFWPAISLFLFSIGSQIANITVKTRKNRLSICVKNTERLPCPNVMVVLRYCSHSGPRITPRINGTGGYPSFFRKYMAIPTARAMPIWNTDAVAAYTPRMAARDIAL